MNPIMKMMMKTRTKTEAAPSISETHMKKNIIIEKTPSINPLHMKPKDNDDKTPSIKPATSMMKSIRIEKTRN